MRVLVRGLDGRDLNDWYEKGTRELNVTKMVQMLEAREVEWIVLPPLPPFLIYTIHPE